MAQVLAHINKVSRMSRTKEEQVMWRKIVEAQSKAENSKITSSKKETKSVK